MISRSRLSATAFFSYLLKPIKADDLLHVLRDAHAEIAAQHEEKEKLQSYAAHAQEQELYLFLSGSPLPPDLRQTLPLLSAAPVFRLLLLKLTAADMLPDSTAVVREAPDAILPSGSFLCASMSESAVACVLGDEACRSVKDLPHSCRPLSAAVRRGAVRSYLPAQLTQMAFPRSAGRR